MEITSQARNIRPPFIFSRELAFKLPYLQRLKSFEVKKYVKFVNRTEHRNLNRTEECVEDTAMERAGTRQAMDEFITKCEGGSQEDWSQAGETTAETMNKRRK